MCNDATLSQARGLIKIFETLGRDELQALCVSKLLIDLRRCAAKLDPTKVNRAEFQRVLGLDPDPSIFIIKMGGPENTDQIMAALGFSFHPWITQKNFPLKPAEIPWEDKIEIVDPNYYFSEEEGLQILKEAGLERPTYEHGIRFADQHGKTMASEIRPCVIFLNEDWPGPDGCCRNIYLYRESEYSSLGLSSLGGKFEDDCVLAGVRPRK